MKIYDISDNTIKYSLDEINHLNQNFIIINEEEFESKHRLFIAESPLPKTRFKKSTFYESYSGFNYLSFIYYQLEKGKFIFEEYDILFNLNYVILITPVDGFAHEKLVQEFTEEAIPYICEKKYPLSFVFYQLLNVAFSNMVDALYDYEETLVNVENNLLGNTKEYNLTHIVGIKNKIFQVKKYNRQLLYVGDQLLLNDNDYFAAKDIRYLHNLDVRINKIYEYSDSLYELSEHLMDVFNSSTTAHTNSLINKLTMFTAFAAPLGIITGLYGMNFVNMPELQNPHGYYIVLGIMAVVVLVTFITLRRYKFWK